MTDKLIAIHGLGYVGLTAAVHWARAGWTVIAYDLDEGVIEALKAGTPRAGDFLAYLGRDIDTFLDASGSPWPGRIFPTSNFEDTLRAKVHSIAVPTERDGAPYDDLVEDVLRRLIDVCAEGTTILIESTLSPGTTDRVLAKRPETPVAYLAKPASVHHIAVCPRRDWFADPAQNLETMPRIVGGVTPEATKRAVELLSNVSKDIRVPDVPTHHYRVAELTKAFENAQLHVQVMLAHEMAMRAPQWDVAEAVRLAGSHPRLKPLYLGFGSGGRCVNMGTQYLLQRFGSNGTTSLLENALSADRAARLQVAAAVARRVNRLGAVGMRQVLVLGIGYRPEFKDAGFSPGLAVAKELRNVHGIEVFVCDPCWSEEELATLTGFQVHGGIDRRAGREAAGSPWSWDMFDAVLLATPHKAFLDLPEEGNVTWKPGAFVLDGQGAWKGYAALFTERGIEYKQVGQAGWL